MVNKISAISAVVIKEMYRRKDFYVLFVLTALITLLLGSMRFFDDDRIVRYLKEICLLLIWISTLVIAITAAARQIPAELESRTILPLLAKPVGRGELIVGKFTGCWAACGIALVVFYFFFGVLSASREHYWPLATYLQAIWLHWMCLGVVIAMVLFGSVVLTAPSSNATISFICVVGILFAGGHLNRVAVEMRGLGGAIVYAAYFMMPHLEWYDVRDMVVHDWGPIDWLICGGATVYAFLYLTMLLGATWLIFRRRSLMI